MWGMPRVPSFDLSDEDYETLEQEARERCYGSLRQYLTYIAHRAAVELRERKSVEPSVVQAA